MTDSRKLWRNIEPHLKKALHTVYLREVSSNQWENIIGQDTQTGSENLAGQGKKCAFIQLAFLVKYNIYSADNMCRSAWQMPRGEGYSHVKRSRMLVGKFELNP